MTEQSKSGKPKVVNNLKHLISPEESERRFKERGGPTTVTFVKYDPKTGKPPVLTELE